MRPICWKLGLTLVVGAIAGLAGGQAVTAGIVQPAPAPHDLRVDRGADDGYGPADYADANPATAMDAKTASGCDDCSDYELGFRFAAARQLTTTADCMDYSWSYQRGCLAWLRKA